MEILRKYTITCAALALWVISAIIFDASETLFGIAIGAFLFEQDVAPMISEKIRSLAKIS